MCVTIWGLYLIVLVCIYEKEGTHVGNRDKNELCAHTMLLVYVCLHIWMYVYGGMYTGEQSTHTKYTQNIHKIQTTKYKGKHSNTTLQT